mmetsp:Transcript_27993/g.71259  ORF Transcript_27993/g.71259 Transcript_27993/m.71259 type:complete len:400 (-) Transcript_27993:2275-3474(-)
MYCPSDRAYLFHAESERDVSEWIQVVEDERKRIKEEERAVSTSSAGGEEVNSAGRTFDVKDVEMYGWLWKKGEKRRNWKKRWAILRKDACLSYYDDPKNSAAIGVLNLKSYGVQEMRDPKGKRDLLIEITPIIGSGETRSYLFDAVGDNEHKGWLTAMVRLSGNTMEPREIGQSTISSLSWISIADGCRNIETTSESFQDTALKQLAAQSIQMQRLLTIVVARVEVEEEFSQSLEHPISNESESGGAKFGYSKDVLHPAGSTRCMSRLVGAFEEERRMRAVAHSSVVHHLKTKVVKPLKESIHQLETQTTQLRSRHAIGAWDEGDVEDSLVSRADETGPDAIKRWAAEAEKALSVAILTTEQAASHFTRTLEDIAKVSSACVQGVGGAAGELKQCLDDD